MDITASGNNYDMGIYATNKPASAKARSFVKLQKLFKSTNITFFNSENKLPSCKAEQKEQDQLHSQVALEMAKNVDHFCSSVHRLKTLEARLESTGNIQALSSTERDQLNKLTKMPDKKALYWESNLLATSYELASKMESILLRHKADYLQDAIFKEMGIFTILSPHLQAVVKSLVDDPARQQENIDKLTAELHKFANGNFESSPAAQKILEQLEAEFIPEKQAVSKESIQEQQEQKLEEKCDFLIKAIENSDIDLKNLSPEGAMGFSGLRLHRNMEENIARVERELVSIVRENKIGDDKYKEAFSILRGAKYEHLSNLPGYNESLKEISPLPKSISRDTKYIDPNHSALIKNNYPAIEKRGKEVMDYLRREHLTKFFDPKELDFGAAFLDGKGVGISFNDFYEMESFLQRAERYIQDYESKNNP